MAHLQQTGFGEGTPVRFEPYGQPRSATQGVKLGWLRYSHLGTLLVKPRTGLTMAQPQRGRLMRIAPQPTGQQMGKGLGCSRIGPLMIASHRCIVGRKA